MWNRDNPGADWTRYANEGWYLSFLKFTVHQINSLHSDTACRGPVLDTEVMMEKLHCCQSTPVRPTNLTQTSTMFSSSHTHTHKQTMTSSSVTYDSATWSTMACDVKKKQSAFSGVFCSSNKLYTSICPSIQSSVRPSSYLIDYP